MSQVYYITTFLINSEQISCLSKHKNKKMFNYAYPLVHDLSQIQLLYRFNLYTQIGHLCIINMFCCSEIITWFWQLSIQRKRNNLFNYIIGSPFINTNINHLHFVTAGDISYTHTTFDGLHTNPHFLTQETDTKE